MRKILFNCSLILLTFIVADHLLVMLSFITSTKILPFVLPFSFLIAILLLIFIERNTSKPDKLWSIVLSLFLIGLSIALSIFYFDFSWDGQWYHQSAIYHIEGGWNPFTEPIRVFEKNNDSSIIYFPKGAWYYAASVYSTIGIFEAGKSINFILLFVALFLVYFTLREYGIKKKKSIVATLIVILNPVVWSEITTYLNDGLLVLYLTIYIAMIFAWFKNPNFKIIFLGAIAIIGVINVKFTGLILFCVSASFYTIYLFVYKKAILLKAIITHSIVLLVSLLIFGFNPYVTNFTERGHPLYPIFGTEKYPSVFEKTGEDSNEIYETPHNMRGKNLIIRMFFANFGRPDNAPYYKEKDAELILLFSSKISDWKAYHFHETRVSGFGPYFGPTLILSFILLFSYLFVDKKNRWIALICVLGLLSTLLFSKHFWWPRFAPQTWLIPLVPFVFLLKNPSSKKLNLINWILAVFLLINGSIVLFFHMRWETRSSLILRKQLTELKEKKILIEIHYGWFKKSMEEKLAHWQIEYVNKPRKALEEGQHKKLTSVVEGYPNMVLYREMNKGETAYNSQYR